MVNTRHIIGVIGFLGFLWTGSNIAKSLQAGISVIWGETPRKYFKRKLLSLGILLAIAAVVLVTILVNVGTSALGAFAAENFGFWWTVLGSMAGLAIDLTVNTTILSTVYYLAPQEKPGLRDVIRGALTTAVIFQVSRYAFGYYISSVSKSVLLYGTIGVFIGVLLWLYIIGAIVFYGAEIVRVLHTRKLRRTTQGPRDIEDAKPAL
jgi:membrane protein